MARDRRAYTPVIRSVTIEPPVIIDGESVTVSWKTKHAEAIEIPGVGRFPPVGETVVAMRGTDRVEIIAIGPGGSISRTSEPIQVLDAVSVERLDVDLPVLAIDMPAEHPHTDLTGPFESTATFPSLLQDDASTALIELPPLPDLPTLPTTDLGAREMIIDDDRSISDDA